MMLTTRLFPCSFEGPFKAHPPRKEKPAEAELRRGVKALPSMEAWHQQDARSRQPGQARKAARRNLSLRTTPAQLACASLGDVYGVPHPGKLVYRAFHCEGEGIRFPTLRLGRIERFEGSE
jgi:hypothetical protein